MGVSLSETRRLIGSLYSGVDGFEIGRADVRRVRAARSCSTYGEIMPTAGIRLLEALCLTRDDVFCDLGCGVGKVVLTAALTTSARRCVGVELAAARLQLGQQVLDRALARGLVAPGRVELRLDDIARTCLDDVTVAYACATAFPTPFTRRIVRRLRGLARAVTFVSTQVLDDQPQVRLDRILRLDMSWRRRFKVYVYRVGA